MNREADLKPGDKCPRCGCIITEEEMIPVGYPVGEPKVPRKILFCLCLSLKDLLDYFVAI